MFIDPTEAGKKWAIRAIDEFWKTDVNPEHTIQVFNTQNPRVNT